MNRDLGHGSPSTPGPAPGGQVTGREADGRWDQFAIDLALDVPNCARVWDYLRGGRTNFTADREMVGRIMGVFPDAIGAAVEHEFFTQRAALYLARRGLRQFLDIGAGLPFSAYLHQTVRAAQPRFRVVYLDTDPIVVEHLHALMTGTSLGRVGSGYGDLTDPEGVLVAVAAGGILDLQAPIALCLNAVVDQLPDEQDPEQVVKTLLAALAPGSALMLTHAAADLHTQEMDQFAEVCASAGIPFYPRTRRQIEAYFDGWELVDPGITTPARWHPICAPGDGEVAAFYAGVALLDHAARPARDRSPGERTARIFVHQHPDDSNQQPGENVIMSVSARDGAYAELDRPAAGLYCLLGACPAPWIDAPGLAALTDLPAPDAERLARSLVEDGLLGVVEDGFALDEDGHLHARITADEWDGEGRGVDASGLDRYFAFLNDAAGAAERLITPSHRPLWEPRPTEQETPPAPPFELEEVAALDWLEARLPVYLAVIRFALLDQRYPLAVDLAHRLWPLWLRRRHPEERYEALLLGLAAATAMQHSGATGQMLTTLAGAVRGQRPIEAYELNRRAVELYQDNGDTLGLAQAMNGMAKSLLSAGHLRQAAAYFADAEQLRAGLGYTRGAALSRQGRGRVALAQGDAAPAAELLADAHSTLLGVGDYYDAALTLAHHGEALAALGDLDGALTDLDAAATTLVQASSLYGQGVVCQIRARILEQAGRGEQAQLAYAHAQTLLAQADPAALDRAVRP